MSSCFTAGGKRRGGKMGKSMGKTWKKRRTKGRKRRKSTNGSSEARKNGRKSHGRHETSERKTVICRVGSERSPCPPFEASPDGTGRRFGLENSGWRAPLGYYNEAKYLPSDFFIDLVLCVVGRFACQVPDISATRTAIPERFFGRKLPQGILCPENRRLERAGIRPPGYLPRRDLVSEARLVTDFYRGIWNKIP